MRHGVQLIQRSIMFIMRKDASVFSQGPVKTCAVNERPLRDSHSALSCNGLGIEILALPSGTIRV